MTASVVRPARRPHGDGCRPVRGRAKVRAEQASLLLRPVLRTLPGSALIGSGAAAIGLVVAMTGDAGVAEVNFDRRLVALRAAAVVLSMGLGFALTDPAATTVAASPASLLYRRAHRLALAVVVSGAFWALAIEAPQGGIGSLHLPPSDLRTEVLAMASLAVMVAAVAGRFVPDALEGVAAGPSVVVVAVGSMFLPSRWRLFSDGPGSPAWRHAHHVWALVAVGAIAMTVSATADPWAWRRPRRSRPG